MSECIMQASEAAERQVISAVMLTNGKAFAEVSDLVVADDFFTPGYRAVFESFARLDQAQQPIDAITVAAELERSGTADRRRSLGADFLLTVADFATNIRGVAYHAQEVAQAAERRRLVQTLTELLSRAQGASGSHTELIEEMERRFLELTQRRRSGGGPIGAKAGLGQVTERVNERWARRSKGLDTLGVPTGLVAFDGMTCGLKPAQLVVLAGRPGAGKSALMVNIAENAAEVGVGVLVFSLEMETGESFERVIASNGVSGDSLRSGDMSQNDFMRMTMVTSRLSEPERIWIDDASDVGALTLLQLRSRARRWRTHEGSKFERILVLVDYLQLVKGVGKNYSNREHEIGEVSRGLKALAKELKCPIIALSQLNRGSESRSDKRPGMSDLRESGQIEQDADLILLLYRDELVNPHSAEKGIAELNVAKHRGGPTGVIKLAWDAKLTRFTDLGSRRYA